MPLVRLIVAAALAVSPFTAARAQEWPTKTVTLVVGTPPAGAVDAYARTIADRLAKSIGQPVIVENKPGANGNISAELVLKQPADGHALWIGTQAMTEINPSAWVGLRWKQSDFAPVIKGVAAPLVLVTNSSVPAKTFAELAQHVKANPGKLSYASFSPGTPSHFLGYQLNEKLAGGMTHVPFKGSAPQVQNILGGHVPLGITQIQTALAHVKAGNLNALATTGAARWRQLPDVPTFAELGYPELSATVWFGVLARAETPAPVMARMVDAMKAAHADAEVRARLEGMGFDVPATVEPQLSAEIREGTERWAKLVTATGFKAGQ